MLRVKRLTSAVAGLVTLSLLTACVGIPADNAIHEGLQLTGQPELVEGTVFRPEGPRLGDSPEDIVIGFLNAATGQSGDYSVARSFMVSDLAPLWKPHDSVTIYKNAPALTEMDAEGLIHVVTSTVAVVDATGHYLENQEDLVSEFVLVQNAEDQWRIKQAPDGIALPELLFRQLFAQQPLYFYDSSYRFLVPDLRWFPTRYSRLTQIISYLLAGPSEYLSNGVLFTAFPEGTQLAIDSVIVTDGVAQIDLTSPVLGLNDRQRKLMFAQLQSSLVGIGGVDQVKVTVDRTELVIKPFASGGPNQNPTINIAPFVLHDGRLNLVQSGILAPVLTFSPDLGTSEIDSMFYHERLNRAVVSNAEGVWYLLPPNPPRNISGHTPAVEPFLDFRGAAWWLDDSLDGVQVYLDGETVQIADDIFDTSGVVSWGMSRDDTRLVVLRQVVQPDPIFGVPDLGDVQALDPSLAGRFQIELYGVVRDSGGRPTSLNPGLTLLSEQGRSIDTVWIDDLTVVYGWQDPEQNYRVSSIEVGGIKKMQPAVIPFVKLSAGNTFRSVRLLTKDGLLFQQNHLQRWEEIMDGVQLLVDAR